MSIKECSCRQEGGLDYTVDEVSGLLGIPRPTLYRYLREYSIPHLRRAGKISIPEESLERIREARELHREGLGTESVRRRLRGGEPDLDGLSERLDQLSGVLEGLQEHLRSSDRSLQAILQGQGWISSTLLDLAERLDALSLVAGQPQKATSGGSVEDPGRPGAASGQDDESAEIVEGGPVAPDDEPSFTFFGERAGFTKPPFSPAVRRRGRFGALARRRRLGLVVVLALLAAAVLMWVVPVLGERGLNRAVFWQGVEEDSGAVWIEATQAAELPEPAGLSTTEAEAVPSGAGPPPVGTRIQVPSDASRADSVTAETLPAGTGFDPGATVDADAGTGQYVESPQWGDRQSTAGQGESLSTYYQQPPISDRPVETPQGDVSSVRGPTPQTTQDGGF